MPAVTSRSCPDGHSHKMAVCHPAYPLRGHGSLRSPRHARCGLTEGQDSQIRIKGWMMPEKPSGAILFSMTDHTDSFRERLIKESVQAFSNAELLAILLRTGDGERDVLESADHLLGLWGGLRGLARMNYAEL